MLLEKLFSVFLITTCVFSSPIQDDLLCKERDSCYGEITSNSERNCRCDEDCFIYGDCCFDADSSNELISRHTSFSFKCIAVKTKLKFSDSFYMIADCPTDWEDMNIANKCLQPEDLDFKQIIPVSQTNGSKLTFRNVYCALCHNMEIESLTPWELKLECPSLKFNSSSAAISHLLFNATIKRWEIRTKDGDDSCTSTVKPGQTSEILVRLCKGDIVSTCPKQWIDHQTRRLCKKHTAYRYFMEDKVGTIFKNKYCAKCNRISMDKLECFHRKYTSPVSRDLNTYGRLMNFAILINSFDLKNSALHCSAGLVYNNAKKQCEELHCSKDMIKVDGKCMEL